MTGLHGEQLKPVPANSHQVPKVFSNNILSPAPTKPSDEEGAAADTTGTSARISSSQIPDRRQYLSCNYWFEGNTFINTTIQTEYTEKPCLSKKKKQKKNKKKNKNKKGKKIKKNFIYLFKH